MIKYVCVHDYHPFVKGQEIDSVPDQRLIGTVFMRINRPDHNIISDFIEKIAETVAGVPPKAEPPAPVVIPPRAPRSTSTIPTKEQT